MARNDALEHRALPTTAWIGRNLRKHREEHGLRQDDVAHRVRELGVEWTRAVIAAIETGGRTLDIGELVLLAVALGIRLSDLLEGDGDVLVGGGVPVSLRLLRDLFKDNRGGHTYSALSFELAQRVTPPSDESRFVIAIGEAERRAAQRLGVTPLEISRQAFQLWGRGLTDERDHRMQDAEPVLGATVAELQRKERALRGHVSRELVAELRAKIMVEHAKSPNSTNRRSSIMQPKGQSPSVTSRIR